MRRMIVEEKHTGPCPVFKGRYAGKEIVLAETGMGRAMAERAAGFVLDHYPIHLLISFGFAGALSSDLAIADVVLCHSLFCERDPDGPAPKLTSTAPAFPDCGDKIKLVLGDCVTVDRLIAEPAKKRALGKAFGAQVVDMESYWVARMASARQIPWFVVRSISDTSSDSVPPFDRFFTPEGDWRWKEALSYFLARPRELAAAVRVVRNAMVAAKSLTLVCAALLSQV